MKKALPHVLLAVAGLCFIFGGARLFRVRAAEVHTFALLASALKGTILGFGGALAALVARWGVQARLKAETADQATSAPQS